MYMKSFISFRFKCFFLHLFVSICIALVSITLVFCVWYPVPLAKSLGVSDIFLMMLAIDVILGPLLTLLVAKKGKKTLKFDLLTISIIQLVALTYGLHSIAVTRPVWIAFDSIRFEVVTANAIPKEELEQAKSPYNSLAMGLPKFVAVKLAENEQEKTTRTFVELETGVASSSRPTLYEPLINQCEYIQKEKINLKELNLYNNEADVDEKLSNYSHMQGYIPLKAFELDMVVLVDQNCKKFKIVDLRPWK